MAYSGTYSVVLVLHLLTVAFVVGPLAVLAVTSPRHLHSGDVGALRDALRSTRLYARATLLTVLLGAAMIGLGDVGAAWSFGQLWVSASFALWFLAVALTLGGVVPAQMAGVQALETGGDPSRAATRIGVASCLALLAWIAIIVLMVVKPGV